MRRPLLALLLLLSAAPAADAASGRFLPGEAVDATGVVRLEDVDLARDGTGAIAYLRTDGVHVARFVDGAVTVPERVDGGIAPATQAAVAASDQGRIVVAFTAAGGVWATVRPSATAGFLPPQQLAAVGSDPSVSLSVGGHAYVVFRSGGDVRAARMDRKEQAFTGLPDALDVDPALDAGANGRPRVATSADGTGLAVWGEGGRVVARRLHGLSVSRAPQELAPSGSDPDVGIEDDSSYAWAVFRAPSGSLARRQRGSAFDEPFAVGDPAAPPRIALSGRGEGYATSGGSGTAAAAVLKDDRFFAPSPLGAAASSGLAVPAVAEGGDGVVAWFGPDGSVRARAYDNNPASRRVTVPAPEVTLSDPALGTADDQAGLEAASDRAGDVLVAWTQVDAAGVRRLAAGTFDRFPGSFRGYTTTKWRRTQQPPLRWAPSFELWGPVTYRVEIDGQVVGETRQTGLTPAAPVPDGLHRWSVVAVDRRGQEQRMPARNLRIDATAPQLDIRVRRRAGGRVEVDPRVTDDPGTGAKASGVRYVRVQVGSARPVVLVEPPFKVVRALRRGTVRVTAVDRAGNVARDSKRVGGGR